MMKSALAILALAVAVAFSPLSELRAATFASPGAKIEADNLTHTVAKKKGKKKVAKKKGKKVASKGPGRCGAYMYFSKKDRKCVDARSKKA